MTTSSADEPTLPDAAEVLADIAVFAVEHEEALDLMRLVGYIDLYQHYLEGDHVSPPVPFSRFVRARPLLEAAAFARASESGSPIVVDVFDSGP